MTLKEFFTENPKAALGFSGGVDSAYLLYAAVNAGAQVQPYFIKTPFQPDFELADAKRLAKELGITLHIIELDILEKKNVAENPGNRCYYCKSALFLALRERAFDDGFFLLLDGTNASDDAGDRPGMQALKEMKVRSPLRECGLTKAEIRTLSKEAGLFTWNKPAYACLATRFLPGERLTAELLRKVETAENRLFQMGFSGFRVRVYHGAARIQMPCGQMEKVLERRLELLRALASDFEGVFLDLEGRVEYGAEGDTDFIKTDHIALYFQYRFYFRPHFFQ